MLRALFLYVLSIDFEKRRQVKEEEKEKKAPEWEQSFMRIS